MAITLPTDLIRKYDRPGPRYTSYPTALEFKESFGGERFVEKVRDNNAGNTKPLSLYFHLPFCKQVCYFCACNAVYTKDRDRAHPYVEQLITEIGMLRKQVHPDREVTQLHWGGGTPTFLHPELMLRLQKATREAFRFSPDAEVSVEVDPREASDQHLQALAEAGFNRISMGVQDFNPAVQEAVNRIQPYEMTASRIETARKLGFGSVNVDLMYGLPLQTLESMQTTLEKTIGLRPNRIAFFNFAYLPELKKHMRRIHPEDMPSPALKLEMLALAVNRLTDSGYRFIGMDHFVLPDDELAIALDKGELHRNFQGYTTRAGAELYGLGITSISDLGDAYSQNVKTEVAYAAKLAKGEFPTWRGANLSTDDLIRREVIMSLLNRFQVDLANVGIHGNLDPELYFSDALDALREYEQDGLVKREGMRISVTDSGRFLIRNICMTFDAYLASPKMPQDQRYSRTV